MIFACLATYEFDVGRPETHLLFRGTETACQLVSERLETNGLSYPFDLGERNLHIAYLEVKSLAKISSLGVEYVDRTEATA